MVHSNLLLSSSGLNSPVAIHSVHFKSATHSRSLPGAAE